LVRHGFIRAGALFSHFNAMRPGIVTVILFLAFGLLAVIFLFRPGHHETAVSEPPSVPVAQPAHGDSPETAPSVTASPFITNTPVAVIRPAAVPAAPPSGSATERVAELAALAMNDDSNSLNTIWSELSNPDPEIRAGALAAVVQFGDRSVTPRLRDLAAQTEDPSEKIAIIQAADYLDLPRLTDAPRARSTNAPAISR
jgi:hypothetical protein